jgi:hypothetical protein
MEEEVIKNSKTFAECIRKIYGYDNGVSRKKFFNYVSQHNLDITHLEKKPFKYERITKECPVCSMGFKTLLGHKNEKTTCSHSCSNTFFRSGENNPNWGFNGDSSERNGYRRIGFTYHDKECVICGENLIVSIHHHDGNHYNNDPENLVPLCPTHHQYVHSGYRHIVIDKIENYLYNFKKKKNEVRNF